MKVITDRNNNSFNLSRLLASIFVIYGHSLSVGPGLDPFNDIIYKLTGIFSASIGVKYFFLLSGILVSASLVKSNDWRVFLISRVFRIYPGLIMSLILVIFILAPIIIGNSFFDLLISSELRTYIWRTLTFTTFGINMSLPEVQVGKWTNMNIPLWTLAPEVTCYLFLLSAYVLTCGNRIILTLLSLAVILDCIVPVRFLFNFLPVRDDNLSYLPLFFAVGVLIGLYKNYFKMSFGYIFAFLFIAILFKGSIVGSVAIYLSILFFILYFFTLSFINKFEIKHDLSYGLYIYGWPCQMFVLYFFSSYQGYIHFVLPLILSAVLAWISWVVIEKPSISLGKKLIKRFI